MVTVQPPPPPPHTTHPHQLFVKLCPKHEMRCYQKKNKDEIYISNAYVGVPPNLKLGVNGTQTSVVAVVADQSTHAIYHTKDR